MLYTLQNIHYIYYIIFKTFIKMYIYRENSFILKRITNFNLQFYKILYF